MFVGRAHSASAMSKSPESVVEHDPDPVATRTHSAPSLHSPYSSPHQDLEIVSDDMTMQQAPASMPAGGSQPVQHVIFPRRKSCDDADAAGPRPVCVSRGVLERLVHLPISKAALRVGLCPTTFKKAVSHLPPSHTPALVSSMLP